MKLPFSHDRRPDAPAAAPAPPAPLQVDLISRAFELANADWTEQEAGEELARLADGDRTRLLDAYEQLIARLIRTPLADPRGVRATRVVSRAARLTATSR